MRGRMCKVVIDPRSFEGGSGAPISGIIYVELDGNAFPDGRWSDFPAVILGWWLDGMIRLRSRSAHTATLAFMDGPYLIELDGRSQTRWRAVAKRSAAHSTIVLESEVSGPQLIESIVRATDMVLSECDRRNWRGGDIEDLRGVRKLFAVGET